MNLLIYELRWVAYACVGSIKVLGVSISLISPPAAAQPALAAIGICRARAVVERYDPARLDLAKRRARELGVGAELRACRGVPCTDNLAQWSTELTFKEK